MKEENWAERNEKNALRAEASKSSHVVVQQEPIFNEAYQHHGWRETDISGTLTAGQNGTVRGDTPLVAIPYTLKIRSGCEGGGKGALVQEDKSATLATNNDQYLFQPVPDMLLDDQGGQQIGVRTDGKSPTLRAEMHGNVPCVLEAAGFKELNSAKARSDAYGKELAPCLAANKHDACVSYKVTEPIPIHDQATRFAGKRGDKADGKGNGIGVGQAGDPMNTLTSADRHAVAYTMQAFGVYKDCDVASGLKARDYKDATDLVCGVDCRNMNEYEELYPTLQAKPNGGQSLNFSGAIRVRYIVRRLTPTECARLQGFPDCWGDIDEKTDFTDDEYRFWLDVRNTHAAINGKAVKEYTKAQMLTWYNKLHTDSAEYKMWGNGIALPPALYCMQGMADALKKERRTMVVYIAGKMTGLPDLGREKFNEAEKRLTEKGYVVLNPARLPDGMPGNRYMPICFAMIDQADAVLMLNNWKDSPGATLEKAYAEYQNKMVFEYDEVKGWECW